MVIIKVTGVSIDSEANATQQNLTPFRAKPLL